MSAAAAHLLDLVARAGAMLVEASHNPHAGLVGVGLLVLCFTLYGAAMVRLSLR
jgi:hypothetical protein